MPDILLRPEAELNLRSSCVNQRLLWVVREQFLNRPSHSKPGGHLQNPFRGRVEASHPSAGIQDQHASMHLCKGHLLGEGDWVKDVKTKQHNSIDQEKNCNCEYFAGQRKRANMGRFQQEYRSYSNLTCCHHNNGRALPRDMQEHPGKDNEINKAQPINIGEKEPAARAVQWNDRSIQSKA